MAHVALPCSQAVDDILSALIAAMAPSRLAPKLEATREGPPLEDDLHEVLADALDGKHKSAETYNEDLQDAFQQMPREAVARAAAMCRDLADEAMKREADTAIVVDPPDSSM